jgi:hypothetical protein
LKTVIVIGEDTSIKTLIIAALSDRLSIELQDYPSGVLDSIILDKMDTAIYISDKTEQGIKKISAVRSVTKSLILISDHEPTGLNIDLFFSLDQFIQPRETITALRAIRSLIESKDVVLPKLTHRQRQVLELYCSLLPAKQAVERAGICLRTYQSILEELKIAFNVPSTNELRQLFCISEIPSHRLGSSY